jgi:flagellar protein FlgJ
MEANSLRPFVNDYRLNAASGLDAGALVKRYANQHTGAEPFDERLKRAAGENAALDVSAARPPERAAPERQAGIRRTSPFIDKTSKLYEQCLELETFLVKTLVSGMRNTVQKSGLVEESYAGKVYEDMLYDEYAEDLTRNAGFGLAEQAYLELTGRRGRGV